MPVPAPPKPPKPPEQADITPPKPPPPPPPPPVEIEAPPLIAQQEIQEPNTLPPVPVVLDPPPGNGRNYSIKTFDALMAYCLQNEASDLHLRTNQVPKSRINLKLIPLPEFPRITTQADLTAIMENLLARNPLTAEHAQKCFDEQGICDFSFQFQGSATRGAGFKESQGTGMVIRFFYSKFVSLRAIGMEHVGTLLEHDSGMILLTGPTGSGKTTLANAMLEHLNTREAIHIGSAEDPIEYVLTEQVARITQRSIPTHAPSFALALRSLLRQDPDVIFLGEIRDREVMESAISAAESGHLVISTLHSTSVCDTLNRIVNWFPYEKERQIRHSLSSINLVVINQRLLRGSRGKALAHELYFNTESTRSTIRNGDISNIADSTLTTKGMVHWDRWLVDLLRAGKIDERCFNEHVRDPDSAKMIRAQVGR